MQHVTYRVVIMPGSMECQDDDLSSRSYMCLGGENVAALVASASKMDSA